MRRDPQHRGQAHGANAYRVDVIKVGAFEFNAFGREPQRFVDHQVGHHRHHPGNGDVGVQPEHFAQCLEHIHLHQHEGDQGVEHHPHHAPGVAVREAREKVRPGQRAGIGVGHIDLELRDHHKQRGRRYRHAVAGEHILVSGQVHLVRVDGAIWRHHVADGQVSQQHTAQHFDDAQQNPTRPARQHAAPPAPARGRGMHGHEAQVIRLLAHLRDEGNAYR